MSFYICSIYEHRPEVCRLYPQPGSYQPDGCGYYFANGMRKGECDPYCQAACCRLPRQNGEPGGAPLPDIAGGLPCKYLQVVEKHPLLKEKGEAGE